MSNVDPLFAAMDDPAWEALINQGREAMAGSGNMVEPDVYAACFGTPAGQAVLADLRRAFVDVTRWVPGEDTSLGYYREGAALAVFHITDMIAQAGATDGTST